jgi:hypothetical protein
MREQRTIRLKGLNLDREFRKIQDRYPLTNANERTMRPKPSPVASIQKPTDEFVNFRS